MRIRKRPCFSSTAGGGYGVGTTAAVAAPNPSSTGSLSLLHCEVASPFDLGNLATKSSECSSESCPASLGGRLLLEIMNDDVLDMPTKRSPIGLVVGDCNGLSEQRGGGIDVPRLSLGSDSFTAKEMGNSPSATAATSASVNLSSPICEEDPQSIIVNGQTEVVLFPACKPRSLASDRILDIEHEVKSSSVESESWHVLKSLHSESDKAAHKKLEAGVLSVTSDQILKVAQCFENVDDAPSVQSELGYIGEARNAQRIRKTRSSIRCSSFTPLSIRSFTGVTSRFIMEREAIRTSSFGDKESLSWVLYFMVLEANQEGLAVNEAVSRLVERGYAMLFQADNSPRSVQVERALRSNPQLLELHNGRFVVSESAVGTENQRQANANCCLAAQLKHLHAMDADQENCLHNSDNEHVNYRQDRESHGGHATREHGENPTRKARKQGPASTKRVRGVKELSINAIASKRDTTRTQRSAIREDPTLPRVNKAQQCNRKDGRGWQCSRRAKAGCTYCEHHLEKIKANHVRSAMKLARMRRKNQWKGGGGRDGRKSVRCSRMFGHSRCGGGGVVRRRRRCFKSLEEIGQGVMQQKQKQQEQEEQEEVVVGVGREEKVRLSTPLDCVLNSDPTEWRLDLFS